MSEGSATYPFETANVDGVLSAGVLFNPKDGGFYEFVDPDTHDDYERLKDPRTGEVLTFGSKIERLMGEVMSGHVRCPIPADEWEDFRTDYIEADDEDYEVWADRWREMAGKDPRVDELAGETECLNCGNEFVAEGSDSGLGPTCPDCGHPSRDPKLRR